MARTAKGTGAARLVFTESDQSGEVEIFDAEPTRPHGRPRSEPAAGLIDRAKSTLGPSCREHLGLARAQLPQRGTGEQSEALERLRSMGYMN